MLQKGVGIPDPAGGVQPPECWGDVFCYISLFPRIPRKRRAEIDSRKMMIPSSTTPLSSFVSLPGSVCYLFGAYLFVGWVMDSSFGILKKSYKPSMFDF